MSAGFSTVRFGPARLRACAQRRGPGILERSFCSAAGIFGQSYLLLVFFSFLVSLNYESIASPAAVAERRILAALLITAIADALFVYLADAVGEQARLTRLDSKVPSFFIILASHGPVHEFEAVTFFWQYVHLGRARLCPCVRAVRVTPVVAAVRARRRRSQASGC